MVGPLGGLTMKNNSSLSTVKNNLLVDELHVCNELELISEYSGTFQSDLNQFVEKNVY